MGARSRRGKLAERIGTFRAGGEGAQRVHRKLSNQYNGRAMSDGEDEEDSDSRTIALTPKGRAHRKRYGALGESRA